jgi:hypothetical protein
MGLAQDYKNIVFGSGSCAGQNGLMAQRNTPRQTQEARWFPFCAGWRT